MATMYLTQQIQYKMHANVGPTPLRLLIAINHAHTQLVNHAYIRMDAHLELDSSSEQVQMEIGAVHMGRSESCPANIVDSSILLTRQYC